MSIKYSPKAQMVVEFPHLTPDSYPEFHCWLEVGSGEQIGVEIRSDFFVAGVVDER
jgi:hypothetical protein